MTTHKAVAVGNGQFMVIGPDKAPLTGELCTYSEAQAQIQRLDDTQNNPRYPNNGLGERIRRNPFYA